VQIAALFHKQIQLPAFIRKCIAWQFVKIHLQIEANVTYTIKVEGVRHLRMKRIAGFEFGRFGFDERPQKRHQLLYRL
jgi:hypothetical protein